MLTKLEEMTQDVLDETFALQLVNDAKDEIEAMRPWLKLQKEQAYTVTSGYSYDVALGALPTRFAVDSSLSEDEGNFRYRKVQFDDRQAKKNDSTAYFLDLANDNLHLGGENHPSKTMYFYYAEYSADITTSTEWAFPDRFHSALLLKTAELYYLSDAGEKSRSWNQEWAVQYERALARMVQWDEQLRLNSARKTTTNDWTPKSNEIR